MGEPSLGTSSSENPPQVRLDLRREIRGRPSIATYRRSGAGRSGGFSHDPPARIAGSSGGPISLTDFRANSRRRTLNQRLFHGGLTSVCRYIHRPEFEVEQSTMSQSATRCHAALEPTTVAQRLSIMKSIPSQSGPDEFEILFADDSGADSPNSEIAASTKKGA
jgi:hypothetical protein